MSSNVELSCEDCGEDRIEKFYREPNGKLWKKRCHACLKLFYIERQAARKAARAESA